MHLYEERRRGGKGQKKKKKSRCVTERHVCKGRQAWGNEVEEEEHKGRNTKENQTAADMPVLTRLFAKATLTSEQ